MHTYLDYYTFSDTCDFINFTEFIFKGNFCIAASVGDILTMDEIIENLCRHFKNKNILILSENDFKCDDPRCVIRLLTSKNIIKIIEEIGQYSPLYLLIITRNISSVFANLAVISYAKQHSIPIVNITVDYQNRGSMVWY